MSDTTIETKIEVTDTAGNTHEINYADFEKESVTFINESCPIEEVTVSLAVKRQAVKFEATNEYFQSKKVGALSTDIKLIREKRQANQDVLNKALVKALVTKTGNMMNFCRNTIKNECINDGIPVRFLGDHINGGSK